ncbi:MAG TPA: patatin-like phospholipase family protein, partial [Chthoniobacteraceae bacterium]|nr:patatin-like phospholipase family protein [Chthoniobacteraceae bacterium]
MKARSNEMRTSVELRPWTFAEVLQQEREVLRTSQSPPVGLPRNDVVPPSMPEVVASIHAETRANPAKATSALCLSGGGIRSATFCLGVLQSLARGGLLPRFDYLSTVSGGGYLGSWLSAWIYREKNPDTVFAYLSQPGSSAADAPEPPQLRHLRHYSNYLAPRLSVTSADTWALAGTFLRNLALNWLVLLPILFVLLILPRFFMAGIQTDGSWTAIAGACTAAALALFLSTWYAASDLPSNGGRRGSDVSFVVWRLVPLVIGAHALALAWAWFANGIEAPPEIRRIATEPGAYWEIYYWEGFEGKAFVKTAGGELVTLLLPEFPLLVFILIVVVPIVLGGVGGGLWARRKMGDANISQRDGAECLVGGWPASVWRIIALIVTTVVGAIGLVWLTRHLFPVPAWDIVNYTAFSPPLVLCVFLVANFLVPGLTSWVSTESDLEWWGRASGWILNSVLASAAIGVVVFLGPVWLASLEAKFPMDAIYAALGGLSGILGLFSALLGASSDTEIKPSTKRIAPRFIAFGAVAFVLILGMFFSFVVDRWIAASYQLTFNCGGGDTLEKVAWIACMLLAIALLMGTLVNVNRFSMHMMYRNRLVRAYLGASRKARERKPHVFTGFDRDDDVRLHELRTQRPLHVINMTLNLVGGANLAWQERQAESFTASPLHCGAWQLNRTNETSGAYQPSHSYGNASGIGLGTAFAISGAAANPNCGYHSSPIVTLLMTLFNLRLGWWLPNPGADGAAFWRRSGPSFALTPL